MPQQFGRRTSAAVLRQPATQNSKAPNIERQTDAPKVARREAGVKGAHEKFCKDCAEVINEKAEICPACGVRQMNESFGANISSSTRNRFIAAILAFFFGSIGIHKFYLGEFGLGVLYLLFCWTFIPMLIALVEAVVYLSTSDEAFARTYGNS